MSTKTGIEWTDATWNPIRGCSRVSRGCQNCYAEKVAYRLSGPGQPYEGLVKIGSIGERRPQWNGKVRFIEKHLLDPLKWKGKPLYDAKTGERVGYAPMRIFVNSMSDLFHENVPDEWIDKIFAVMALTPQHVFQVLTKRPERMLGYLSLNDRPAIVRSAADRLKGGWPSQTREWPYVNVWLGVSVEDQKTANQRLPLLLQTPAAVRFISAEPLLEGIDLREAFYIGPEGGWEWQYATRQMLHWVIVGGESGPGARPMDLDWAWYIVQQCRTAKVPCFVKQLGSHHPAPGDPKGGDHLFWPEHLRVRQFPGN